MFFELLDERRQDLELLSVEIDLIVPTVMSLGCFPYGFLCSRDPVQAPQLVIEIDHIEGMGREKIHVAEGHVCFHLAPQSGRASCYIFVCSWVSAKVFEAVAIGRVLPPERGHVDVLFPLECFEQFPLLTGRLLVEVLGGFGTVEHIRPLVRPVGIVAVTPDSEFATDFTKQADFLLFL